MVQYNTHIKCTNTNGGNLTINTELPFTNVTHPCLTHPQSSSRRTLCTRCKGPLAVKKPDFFTDKSEKVRLSSFADQTLSRAVALSLAANVPPSDIRHCDHGGTIPYHIIQMGGPLGGPWWDHWWHLSRKRLMMESLVTVR